MAAPIELRDLDVEVPLADWDPDQGVLKSDFAPTVGTIANHNYNAVFSRLNEVHGNYEANTVDDASFLVIRVTPRKAPGTKGEFRMFKLTLKLSPARGSKSNDEPPRFISWEPAKDGAVYYSEVTKEISKTTGIAASAGAQAPASVASVTFEGSKSVTENSTDRMLHTLTSGVESATSVVKEQPDGVWWQLDAAEKSNNVGDSIGVALLVRRSPGSQFYILAETEAKLGFGRDISGAFKSLVGKRQKVTLGPFGPAGDIANQKIPAGVDPQNLHAMSTEERLGQFAFVHVPEKAPVRTFYDRPADSIPGGAANLSAVKGNSLASTVAPSGLADTVADVSLITTAPIVQGSQIANSTRGSPSLSLNPRAIRHKKMAALYERLAQLHREEAAEAERLDEIDYVEAIERDLHMH